MSYATEWASAYADVAAAGAVVMFTKSVQGAVNETTGISAASTTVTAPGVAIKTTSQPRRYADLGLTDVQAMTLFWVPATYGDLPALSATGSFGGETLTVKHIDALAPDGTAISASLVVVR